MHTRKFCLIGSGYMAEAIIKGLTARGQVEADNIYVVNPLDEDRVDFLADTYGIVSTEIETAFTQTQIVILAFKPQDFLDAMLIYKTHMRKDHLLVSILAGVTTSLIQRMAGCKLPVIRTMPNLALGVGASATAYCMGTYAQTQHAQLVEEIFSTVGTVTRVEEDEMDVVTGLSGTGPAYFYYLLEAMVEGAKLNGLSEEKAMILARQTLLGTAKLLENSDEHPKTLRKKITSSKGTTEAAIKKMASCQFVPTVQEGITAATKRSKELGKIFEENADLVVNI